MSITSFRKNFEEQNILNVHIFDGKLGALYKKYILLDDTHLKQVISFDESIKEINFAIQKINDQQAVKTIMSILDKISTDHSGNFDPTNSIQLNDLLPRVWKFYREFKFVDQIPFFEQIYDMRTGMCPQGRSGGRIFQLYEMLIEYLIEYLKPNNSLDKDMCQIIDKIKK